MAVTGWDGIASDETLDRATRLILSAGGTLSQEHNETLRHEMVTVVNELDAEQALFLICALATLAAVGVRALAEWHIEPLDDDGDESIEREAARQAVELDILEQVVSIVRDLRERGTGQDEPAEAA